MARSPGVGADPFETDTEKREVIQRMQNDPGYLAVKMFPHLYTCENTGFHTGFAHMVGDNPVFKGYAEWGRGLAKSIRVDIILTVWLWMNGQTKDMCLVSDTFDRAFDLLDNLRAEFEANPILVHYSGEQKLEGYREKGNFTTQSGFIAKAFGVRQNKMRQVVDWMCDRQHLYTSRIKIYWQYEAQFRNDEVRRTTGEAEMEHGVLLNLVKRDTPRINKLMRLASMQPYYQNARTYYNSALKPNHDSQVGIRQLVAVEPGGSKHDDSPDADQQAVAELEKYNIQPRRQEDKKPWKAGRMKQTYSF